MGHGGLQAESTIGSWSYSDF